jgi:RNA polymerase sigma-70 factor, ECF subfamily
MSDADFRDAFRNHKDVVFRFVCRMTGSRSAAEDIVQECFMALWRKPEAYDPRRGKLRAFLLGVARNLVLKRWRDARPHEALDETLGDEMLICLPLDIAENERAEAVERAVLALPQLQREVVVLAEYEEMSLEEIAQATGAEIAAVKSRLHRARQNLRRMLAPFLESKGVFHGTK